MATFRLRRVVAAETDGYMFDKKRRLRLCSRLLLTCGHTIRRFERFEHDLDLTKARCYRCAERATNDC